MTTEKWVIDPAHSEIRFRVKHMMISTVTGQFNSFSARIETEGEDFSTAKVKFSADISSIFTGNEQRDAHLRSGDFFDAENHPQLTFDSSSMEKVSEDRFRMHGDLSMRGKTQRVVLDVEFGGTTVDPWGNTRAGFSVSGSINRKDYGVSFSMISETGGILLSDEVKLHADAEFVKETVLQEAEA